jgi:hypothetical protein
MAPPKPIGPIIPDPPPSEPPPQAEAGDSVYFRAEQCVVVPIMVVVGGEATPHQVFGRNVYFRIPEGLLPGAQEVNLVSDTGVLGTGFVEVVAPTQ